VPTCKRTVRLENKVKIYSCYHDRVLTGNEWGNDPVRRSGSELIRVRCGGGDTGTTDLPRGDSGQVQKKKCSQSTNTLPSFDPDQLVHEKPSVFWTRSFSSDTSLKEILKKARNFRPKKQTKIYLIICDLLNDAASSSVCIESKRLQFSETYGCIIQIGGV
jgi:hypothetical protein